MGQGREGGRPSLVLWGVLCVTGTKGSICGGMRGGRAAPLTRARARAQARNADQRRREEMEARRATRDARRAEYAKARPVRNQAVRACIVRTSLTARRALAGRLG
jgi:hypothetical protein